MKDNELVALTIGETLLDVEPTATRPATLRDESRTIEAVGAVAALADRLLGEEKSNFVGFPP